MGNILLAQGKNTGSKTCWVQRKEFKSRFYIFSNLNFNKNCVYVYVLTRSCTEIYVEEL